MNKAIFSLTLAALLLLAPQAAKSDVSVDFFYNNLSGGSWIDVGDYGYCWQPDVAVSNNSWRPYADGYWAYTDLGWTWVSYEDFGWATYHYGRWAKLSDVGWVWVPGRDADLEWGPAWVSWRTGGEYIGWAPLPPETMSVAESQPLTGHLDVEFNIGPEYYNFVDVRYIGEPVLRERIVAPAQNITYIQQTVNVTNITYKNKTVYNYGPDVNIINRTSARPIQRLRLDREQSVDVAAAARTGGLTKVQGDRLVVAAPMHVNRAAQQVAPQNVKTKVAAARVDRGWSAVGDEKAQAEFKQKIRSQNVKNVPPPAAGGAAQTNAAARMNAAASAAPVADKSASPAARGSNTAAFGAAAGAAGNAAATDNEKDAVYRDQQARGQRGQRRAGEAASEGISASPAISPGANGSSKEQMGSEAAAQRGRGQAGQQRNRFPNAGGENAAATNGTIPTETNSPAAATGAGGATQTSAAQGGEEQAGGRQGRGRQNDRAASMEQSSTADEASAAQAQERRARQMQNLPAETAPGDLAGQGGGSGRQQGQGGGERAGADVRRRQGQSEGEARGQGERQRENRGQADGNRGQGQGRGGKRGQGEATPAPTP